MKYSKFKQSLIDQNLWNSDDEELVLPSSTVSSTVSSTNSLKECVICASEQNVNDFITCLYCNWTFCYSCCEQWLLSHVDFKCMNCKKLWSMQFLYENLNWSFYN